MPLHPTIKALFDSFAAMNPNPPPLDSLAVKDVRAGADSLIQAPDPAHVLHSIEDRMIPGPAGEIPIRIYVPEGQGPFGVLVFFHGGGWVYCTLDTHDAFCRAWSFRAPCVVVSVAYRLAPEHKFPAALEDCFAATEWVAAHAGEFNGDSTRMVVGGDSAGGNLAVVTALTTRSDGGLALQGQMLLYPVLDVHDMNTACYAENEKNGLNRESMAWYRKQYLEDESKAIDERVSPLRIQDLSGLPPALVITAECDILRDEGEQFARRLSAAGVAVQATRYAGMPHGFATWAAIDVPEKQQAMDECVRWLQGVLK